MEGPKVPSEAWRREAPERRGGSGLKRGAVAPPQYGGLGATPQKIFFLKSTLKSRIFFGIFASGNGLFCSEVKAGLDNRKYKMVQ